MTEVTESPSTGVPPLHPSQLIPTFPSPPPANSCTLPKTPSQLIRHCLLPSEPVHKRPPRSQQAFPLKLLHWWPPGMPVALGTGEQGSMKSKWRGGGGWSGKLDNRNSPIMLMCWGKPVKNWRATKGNAFQSRGLEVLHPTSPAQLHPVKHTTKQTHASQNCNDLNESSLG